LKEWGKKDDSVILNHNDNMFQLAFRTQPIWDMVAEVFKKFEAQEVKGPKAKLTKGKGKSKPTEVMKAHAHMNMTEWRYMQPLKDANIVTPVL
jgi:hypothetical protein